MTEVYPLTIIGSGPAAPYSLSIPEAYSFASWYRSYGAGWKTSYAQ